MGRGPPLHSPLHSRREPTPRERAKLADEKVAACKAAKEDFDASLKQLRFKVLGAKGQVEAKARDEAQRAALRANTLQADVQSKEMPAAVDADTFTGDEITVD